MGRTAWLPMPRSGCPLSKLQCVARKERTANCEGLHHRIRMVRLAELGGRRAARRSRLLVLVFQQPDVSWPILYLKVVPIKASVAPFDSLFVTVTKNRLGDVATDYEIVVMDLLEGQYKYPLASSALSQSRDGPVMSLKISRRTSKTLRFAVARTSFISSRFRRRHESNAFSN
jgi:hypothetical protein